MRMHASFAALAVAGTLLAPVNAVSHGRFFDSRGNYEAAVSASGLTASQQDFTALVGTPTYPDNFFGLHKVDTAAGITVDGVRYVGYGGFGYETYLIPSAASVFQLFAAEDDIMGGRQLFDVYLPGGVFAFGADFGFDKNISQYTYPVEIRIYRTDGVTETRSLTGSTTAQFIGYVGHEINQVQFYTDRAGSTFHPYLLVDNVSFGTAQPASIAAVGDVEIVGICIVEPECLNVGISGAGSLEINGGRFVTDGVFAARGPGSTGTVTVRGTGTSVSINGHRVPDSNVTNGILVGEIGIGDLSVLQGAIVGVLSVNSFIGNLSGSVGTVAVDGTGSQLSFDGFIGIGNGSPDFGVGGPASGVMSISNGGTVISQNAVLGVFAGTTGTVNIDGTISTFNAGEVAIGGSGIGVIAVDGGGTLNVGTLAIGADAGGTGTLRVSGANSVAMSAHIIVGRAGTGRLEVRNGAQVLNGLTGSAVVGEDSIGRGSVLVDKGSLWDAGSLLVLGGAGKCNVLLNGTIRAGTIVVGPDCIISGKGVLQGAVTNNGGKIVKGINIVPAP